MSLVLNTDAYTQMEETPHVAAVSQKILPFWPADPQLWFCQVEAHVESINSEQCLIIL